MCAEGMVSFAICALAMIFTLPCATRRQKQTMWLLRRGDSGTFDVHQRCVEALGFNGARAVATCVSQIRLDARRPLDSTTSHGDAFQIL